MIKKAGCKKSRRKTKRVIADAKVAEFETISQPPYAA